MAELNFSQIFKTLGKKLVARLEKNIRSQQGIDSTPFVPSKGSIKNGKVKNDGGTHPRLFVTGKLAKNAFMYSATANKLSLFANERVHSRGISYSDIIYYNNKPTSDNPNSPLVFPTNDNEANMIPEMQEFKKQLTDELERYFKQTAGISLRQTIKIG